MSSVLGSSGRPLDAPTRAFFEPRFGADFSRVRIHTDHQASEAARAIQAKAFTTGQDIVFGPGQFAPDSGEGQRLLAHELTHTVQQRDGAFGCKSGCTVQRSPDGGGPSVWDTISSTVKNAGSAVMTGASSAGNAVVEGAKKASGAVMEGVEGAGEMVVEGAKSAAGSVVQTVSAAADLLALQEKLAKLSALLKDYAPLPDGLIRLKNELMGEKARLMALGESLKAPAAATLPAQVTSQISAAGGGGAGAAGGAGSGAGGGLGEPAGGCGLCYGNEPGSVGPREAGRAAHDVIQNILAPQGVKAELPLGDGRVDLAVVHEDIKRIEIGEIKPLNLRNIDAGIDQLATRLLVIPTLAKYQGFDIKPLKYPLLQNPIRFPTDAPPCREQPGFCFSHDMFVLIIPTEGLYLYSCKPSYSELLRLGCKCKCAEGKRLPDLVGSPAKERDREREFQPVAINWAKVGSIAIIIALAAALIAMIVCAFVGTGTVIGIPVAAVCAFLGLGAAVALAAMMLKIKNEPDTTA